MNGISSNYEFIQQKQLFRNYDIRGDRRLFSNEFVSVLIDVFIKDFTKVHASEPITVSKQKIVIGYDVRHGSKNIAQQFAYYFAKANFEVIWLGLVTSPMLFFWAEKNNKTHDKNGIMITASHSKKEFTGIKWTNHGISPTPEKIQEYWQKVTKATVDKHFHPKTHVTSTAHYSKKQWFACQSLLTNIERPCASYLEEIDNCLQKIEDDMLGKTTMFCKKFETANNYLLDTVVIDCLNGATGSFVKSIFSKYVKNLHIINDIADPEFPHGNPDPTEAYRLIQLQNSVINYAADLGLAFDGDGDRLVVVDNKGQVIDSDNLIYLLAQTINTKSLASNSNKKVLFDIKCSHQLPKMLSDIGVIPVISETGSNIMRQKILEAGNEIVFAGELSGHFIFNDGHFMVHDDGIYAALRLMLWLTKQNHSLAHIHQKLPTVVATADTYIDTSVREDIIVNFNKFLQDLNLVNKATLSKRKTEHPLVDLLHKDINLTTIDGIRLDLKNGFGLIRLSNTSSSLTVRFAGDTVEDVKKIQKGFAYICRNFDTTLAKDIEEIQPFKNRHVEQESISA